MVALQRWLGLDAPPDDVEAMREAFERSVALASPDPPPVPVRDDVGGPLPLRWYEPPRSTGVWVYLHGGGWVVGGLQSHDTLCRALAVGLGRTVVAVEYPLAPEHPWPVAIEAIAAAWPSWLEDFRAEGLADGGIWIGGDSAGANLAAHVCLLLRDGGGPTPDRQVLLYPGLDPRCASASHREFREGYLLDAASIATYLALYRPDPTVSLGSIFAAEDHGGLPPATVLVAGFDPLRDEGIRYAQILQKAGVEVDLLGEPSLTHGFLNYVGLVPEAERAFERLLGHLRAVG